jgi:hypothetical protein
MKFHFSASWSEFAYLAVAAVAAAVFLLTGCGSTESVTASAEIERPSAVHVGPVDTVRIAELAPLPPAHRPGAVASLPLSVTEAEQPDTTSPAVELLGIEVSAETIRTRTRVAGVVQEQAFRNVRALGQSQTLRPDSTGRLSADVAGEAEPERVEVEVDVPKAKPETPIYQRWWFGPALLLALALLLVGATTLRRVLVVTLLLAISSPAAAQGDRYEPPRNAPQRAAIVGTAAVTGFATGFALGWRDGVNNDLRWAVDAHGYGSSEALALNREWHRWGWITKPALVVDLSTGVAIGGVARPDVLETLFLAASWGASLGVGFHLGHNAQQGQRWDYFGSVDPSDQWAKAIGPTAVTAGAIVVAGGLLYLTYEVLR